ncbi:conserved hypothetical protein [Gammaproteobacteria bacterium]
MSEETTETKTVKKVSKLKGKDPSETKSGKIKGVIFGKSGVGKTWFALSFPAPYYIDTEGGADLKHYQARLKKAGGAYMGPQEGSLDFETIIDQMKALASEQHPYKTLIIDSITKVYQTAIANEAERLGGKDAFGASKKPAIALMRRLINWTAKLDMNIWFIAHEATEWGMVNDQRQEVGQVPDAWDKLIYELDLTLRVEKRGPSRVAVVRKSRLMGFPDADQFPLEYADFATRYGKDFIEASVAPITLATEDQVKQITGLLETVKVDEKEIEKLLTKAGAENWKELTSAQADSTLIWLRNKTKV